MDRACHQTRCRTPCTRRPRPSQTVFAQPISSNTFRTRRIHAASGVQSLESARCQTRTPLHMLPTQCDVIRVPSDHLVRYLGCRCPGRFRYTPPHLWRREPIVSRGTSGIRWTLRCFACNMPGRTTGIYSMWGPNRFVQGVANTMTHERVVSVCERTRRPASIVLRKTPVH